MRTIRSVAELRDVVGEARRSGQRVGFVPTMGALHDGHLSLIRAAREASELVVVSLFVNPTQFNEKADLAAYPRNEEHDATLAAEAGTDVLFAPEAPEIYPDGYSTSVRVRGVSEPLEGAHRGAGHFDGVATVVAKLLIAVAPDVAWFGQKDAQQVAVVRRVVADLGLPVTIETGPTVREPDGLAMSSRNVRLSAADRPRALALKAGLDAVAGTVAAGYGASVAESRGADTMSRLGVEPEYLALVNPTTFAPATDLRQPSLAVVAAHVGGVRLIDNLPIAPQSPTEEHS